VAVALLVALAVKEVLPNRIGGRVPTDLVVASLAVCAVVLPLARAVILASYRDIDVDRRRVVVVGSGTPATDAAVRLERSARVQVVGFVNDDPAGSQPMYRGDQPMLGGIDSLATVCRHTRAGRVLVLARDRHEARTDAALRSLPETVSVHVVPPYVELTGWKAAVEDLGGLTVVDVDGGASTPSAWSAKRALDVVVALAGLVVLLPVLAVVAVAVRLSSPGPVLFAQVRIGRDRAPFKILKFRTMRRPDPAGGDADSQAAKDARVTRAGRLLRRTGLDEIPQLWNVLVGDMSLVGPRPLIPEETKALSRSVASRFDVKPGMTGLWQICGQHDLRWDEMCQLDVAYVSSWSFRTDLRILAATPQRLLQGGGTIGARWQPPTP
jgi:exopolysaccharide biosynthesis polyprenyl glycosylphosphotransferase